MRLGVLHDVSFTAPARQLTALVGPSGAGKTTITHLVARLYDPGEGAVRVGGFDLRDVTQESLHDAVGVVTQDAHLYHDTIRANLAYARPDATEAELIEACEAARIGGLIAELSSIREADQILVIDEGRVRERGRHDELLAAGGRYADLYRTQFARQEPRRPGGHFPPPPRPPHGRPWHGPG